MAAPGLPQRRSSGSDHDHIQGAYFVTLCTVHRREWFGRVVGAEANAVMEPNDLGQIVQNDLDALPNHFPNVRLDQVQLMPDHLHMMIIIANHGSTRRINAADAPTDVPTTAVTDIPSRPVSCMESA